MTGAWNLPRVDSAERRRRRAVGGAVLIAMLAIMVFGFWKVHIDEATQTSLVEQGVTHLDQAIVKRDESAWEEAHRAFRLAAGHNAFDAYPVFCLATLDQLRALYLNPDTKPPVDGADTHKVSVQVVAGDYTAARETLMALNARASADTRPRINYYIRLVTDLEVIAFRRRGRP